MTSLRYLTCLFLLTVSLTDLSKAGCRDHFTKNAWKKDLTKNLPDYIDIQMDRKSEDVMRCSIKDSDAASTLEDCFDDTGDCEGESHNLTRVAYYQLMCLADIAMNRTEKEEIKASTAQVCKAYQIVCEPFLETSSTSAPKITASSTAAATTTASPATPTPTTATAPPSSPKMTTLTSSKATATTASPTTPTTASPTTATAPPSSPKMTTPPYSTATATTPTTASPTTATAPPSSPKMTTPPYSTATATTAPITASPTTATAPPSSPETATSTSSTATTVSPATPTTESVTAKTEQQSASARSDKNTAYATNETDNFKLQIVIVFLIFTNILVPLAVYMSMRRQRNKESFNDVNRNMPDTVQMTIQPQTVVQTEDSGEGAILLKTPQCSIIIHPPETTQTK